MTAQDSQRQGRQNTHCRDLSADSKTATCYCAGEPNKSTQRLTVAMYFLIVIVASRFFHVRRAYFWHCLRSMRRRVYASVGRPSVRPSVHLSVSPSQHMPQQKTSLSDRLLHGAQQRGARQANAGSATLPAYVVAEHRLV